MPSIALARTDVIVGVDTHKDEHVAVIIDGLGGRLAEQFIPATAAGYAQLQAWAHAQGHIVAFGVEGTGSYGSGLTRFLRRNGHTVYEVSRPPRKAERRLQGKSDTVDAEHAARQVLAGTATAVPKLGDGDIETLRLVKVARDTAVKAHSQAMITLKATLVTASDELRAELEPLTDFKLITACAAFPPATELGDAGTAMRHVLGTLACRWLTLHEEIKIHSRHLKARTKAVAPQMVAAYGIGPTSPPSCSSPRVTTPTGSAPTPPTPSCAGRVRSPHPRARPTAIDSTAAATGRRTRRCFAAWSCGCAGTHRRSRTSSDAPPKGCRNARSSAASSATSPARSTSCCPPPTPPRPRHNRLDVYRSINALAESTNGPYKAE